MFIPWCCIYRQQQHSSVAFIVLGYNTTISDAACETFHILRSELSGHTFNYWYCCRSSWGPCCLGFYFLWGRLYTKSVKNKSCTCEMKRGQVKAVGSKGNGLGLINRKSVPGLHLSSPDETLHRDSGSTGTSDVLYLKMPPSLGLLLFTELHNFHSCLWELEKQNQKSRHWKIWSATSEEA